MRVGDINLYVEMKGGGQPLVIVHGSGLSHELYKPSFEKASEFSKVVFYDQRGCGRNAPISETSDLTLDDFISDLEVVRENLNLDNMTLLGHSWGAYLALAYALEHEPLIRKLILVCPITPYAETEKQTQQWHKKLTPAMRREIEKTTKSSISIDEKIARSTEVTLPLYFHDLVAMEQFRRWIPDISGIVVERLANPAFYKDLRPELKNLRIPVTILIGSYDRRTPTAYAEEIRDHLYDPHLLILEGCGHFPFLERPNLFINTIRNEMKIL